MNRIIQYCFLCVLLSATMMSQTSIKNSKHDLSVNSTGSTIKALSEQEICVFCHTPHKSSAIAQLWNHQPTNATYTLYSSDYLTSKTYATPGQPKQKSKLCMSCHDGTIALGSVINTAGSGTTGTITMGGGITTMPAGPGNLGITLVDDHPIGFGYSPASDSELVARTWPWAGNVKLDPNLSSGTVECITCHNPHNNQYSKFLQISNTNAALCEYCHNKIGWNASIHKNSLQAYTPTGGTATTVAEYSCRNCHKAHSGGGTPYILRAVEQNTCYDGTNTGCHGSSATSLSNRIQPELNKTWRHTTNTIDGLHKNISGGESALQLGSSNRHAECPDCHNPHQATVSVTKATRGALRISGALKNSWGVEPTWPAPNTGMLNNDVTWAVPTIYTKVSPAIDEYQVCLKCHSGYVTLPNLKRDIAAEINPNYTSYHGIVPGGITNANVTTITTNEPWATNKRVWCSDCHGSESATSPKGVHGSTLTGVGPGTSNSDKMLIATIQSSSTGTPLCLTCHKVTSYNSGSTGSNYPEHNRGNHQVAEGCFACHMWDHAGTTLNTGGKSEKIIAHGWNKRYYWRESGTVLAAGTRVMADKFNGGFISDMNYTGRTCYNDADPLRGCDRHSGGQTY